jgi:Flp pilus assembly protein CpaB
VRRPPSPPLRPLALWWARRRLHRRPLLWWAAVVGLSLTAGLTLTGAVGRARAEAERFGPLTPVLVARRDLAVGARLTAEQVVVRERPAGLVPEGALSAPPQGLVVAEPVLAGEPVVAARLSPFVLPPGARALAVPTGPGRLDLRPGDRVDVLATFDPLIAPPGHEPTEVVARAAVVVDVRGQGVTVAVTEAETPGVALALAQATITLALTPGGTVPADG